MKNSLSAEQNEHIKTWNEDVLNQWNHMVKHTNGAYKKDCKLSKDKHGRFYIKLRESWFKKLCFAMFGDGKLLIWLMYLPLILSILTIVGIIIVIAHFW